MSSRVRDAPKRLYMDRVGQNGASSSSGSCSSASLCRASNPSVGNAFDHLKRYNIGFMQHLVDEDSVECKSELDRYLWESFEDPNMEGLDIMMQRKVNSSRYQVLSQIAHDVLVIHVSIVTSKSASSTGERVLDSLHSSLSPNTVEALICTYNQLKDAKKKRPMNLQECMDNVEDMEGFEIDTSV